ncbi:hypothetical protein GCM10010266_16400 [Streptomyces griseomycini]|nr:hypothetical protein GCM10010266_16400 [Streptomyces griseomycini]
MEPPPSGNRALAGTAFTDAVPASSRFHKFTSGGTLRVAGEAGANKGARAAGWGAHADPSPLSNAG